MLQYLKKLILSFFYTDKEIKPSKNIIKVHEKQNSKLINENYIAINDRPDYDSIKNNKLNKNFIQLNQNQIKANVLFNFALPSEGTISDILKIFNKSSLQNNNMQYNVLNQSKIYINSDGTVIAIIEPNGKNLLFFDCKNLEQIYCFEINSQLINNNLITSFSWDDLINNKLYITFSDNTLREYLYDLEIVLPSQQFALKLTLSRYLKYNKNDIIKICKLDNNKLVILYKNGIEAYNTDYCKFKLIYSNSFSNINFINITKDSLYPVFIIYSKKFLYIYSSESFNYARYSFPENKDLKLINVSYDFRNSIFLVFVELVHLNIDRKLLMFILESTGELPYHLNNSKSNLSEQYYQLSSNNYQFLSDIKYNSIQKIQYYDSVQRLLILFTDNENKQRLFIFKIHPEQFDIYNKNLGFDFYEFGSLRNYQIEDFTFGLYKTESKHEKAIIIRFSDDLIFILKI